VRVVCNCANETGLLDRVHKRREKDMLIIMVAALVSVCLLALLAKVRQASRYNPYEIKFRQ